MAQMLTNLPQRGGEVDLLDVHVEQVAQQPDVPQPMLLKKCCRVGLPCEEVGLVAVERFVEKHLPVAGGTLPEGREALREQLPGGVERYRRTRAALHRTENGGA